MAVILLMWVVFHCIKTHSLFIRVPVGGHLGCCQFLAPVDKVTVNICVWVSYRHVLTFPWLVSSMGLRAWGARKLRLPLEGQAPLAVWDGESRPPGSLSPRGCRLRSVEFPGTSAFSRSPVPPRLFVVCFLQIYYLEVLTFIFKVCVMNTSLALFD